MALQAAVACFRYLMLNRMLIETLYRFEIGMGLPVRYLMLNRMLIETRHHQVSTSVTPPVISCLTACLLK